MEPMEMNNQTTSICKSILINGIYGNLWKSMATHNKPNKNMETHGKVIVGKIVNMKGYAKEIILVL